MSIELPGGLRGEICHRSGPAVLLIPGFGAVVDAPLRKVARHFAGNGLSTLVLDRPGFGASAGEPRQELDPERDVRAFHASLAWLRGSGYGPIGVWGTSFGAAEALLLADRPEVGAIALQAPPSAIRRHPLVQAELERVVERDMQDRLRGAEPRTLPLVSPDRPCAIAGRDAWEHLRGVSPNHITLRSLLLCSSVDSAALLARVTVPTIAVGVRDDERALGSVPCEHHVLEGGHFDLYGSLLTEAAEIAAGFFRRVFG